MNDEKKRCEVCGGKGYLRCACWPGDCICAYGDEDCDECNGEGVVYNDYDDYLDARDIER